MTAQSSEAFYQSTLELCADSRFKMAAEALNRPHRLTGDDPWILSAMALVCRAEGAYAPALAWGEAAIRADPALGVGQAEAGLALAAMGRHGEAAILLQEAATHDLFIRDQVKLRAAEALFDSGEIGEAARFLLDAGVNAADDDARMLLWVCAVLEPTACGKSVLQGWNEIDYARRAAAKLISAAERRQIYQADTIAARLLRGVPGDPYALGALGVWRLRAGRFTDAERFFHEARFQERSDPVFESHHPLLLYGQQRYLEAIQAVRTLAKPSARLLAIRADCHRRLGEAQLARACAEDALKVDRATALADVVLLRTDAAFTDDERLERVTGLLAQSPDQPEFLIYLADLLWSADPKRACAMAAQALRLDPVTPDAILWSDRIDGPDRAKGQLAVDSLSLVGLYAAKADSGGYWPTDAQTELLQIAIETEIDSGVRWAAWCKKNDIADLDAGTYRLFPMVFRRLLQDEARSAPHFQTLFGVWRKSQFENIARFQRILPTLDALEEAGIRVMLLKGAPLAEQLYGDWGSRPMSDIDILVKQQDAERAHAVIAASGLRPKDDLSGVRLKFQYATTFYTAGGGSLDLHWRPMEEMVARAAPDDIFWGSAKSTSLLGRSFLTPNLSIQLFHTIIHGVKWNYIAPIRWIPDALLLLEKGTEPVDWSLMADLAVRLDCVLPLQRGLKYLARTFSIGRERISLAEIKACSPSSIEDSLFRVRSSEPLRSCSLKELQDLHHYYAEVVNRHEGTVCVVVGGRPKAAIQAWCARKRIQWLPVLDRTKIKGLLEHYSTALCIHGDMNGRYFSLARASSDSMHRTAKIAPNMVQ